MAENIYQSLFENSYSIKLIIHPATGKIMDANNADTAGMECGINYFLAGTTISPT